jgi:hypothetical protein
MMGNGRLSYVKPFNEFADREPGRLARKCIENQYSIRVAERLKPA